MNHRQSRFIVIVCVLLSALVVAGCSESPQEKYNDATSKLADAKKARQKAQGNVADAQDQVDDAKKKLDKAQDKLQDARQKVIAATQAVDKIVNDEVLFRTLQRDLLDKDKFSKSAISVGVNHRVVTLIGTVPDEQTHKQALQTVRNQAGVASVKDQLKVANNNKGNSKSGQMKSKDGGQKPADNQNGGSGGGQKPTENQNGDSSNAPKPAENQDDGSGDAPKPGGQTQSAKPQQN